MSSMTVGTFMFPLFSVSEEFESELEAVYMYTDAARLDTMSSKYSEADFLAVCFGLWGHRLVLQR